MTNSITYHVSKFNDVINFLKYTAPIDSHLHVWSNGEHPFILEQNPAPELAHCQAESLFNEMNSANIGGALIVQPINHKYDHSYLSSVLKDEKYQGRFKGMCLLDPEADDDYLPTLKSQGFQGVRFNPYLFPNNELMSEKRGMKLFKQAGDLNMPVGIMCFKGLNKHYEDICKLLNECPNTKIIIDHWGFILQDGAYVEESWDQLLSLATLSSNIYVKLSAPFRNSIQGWPYTNDLSERFLKLINTFGANRLMIGSDYPFTLTMQESGYSPLCGLDKILTDESEGEREMISEEEYFMLVRGTVESLFGKWPEGVAPAM